MKAHILTAVRERPQTPGELAERLSSTVAEVRTAAAELIFIDGVLTMKRDGSPKRLVYVAEPPSEAFKAVTGPGT